MSVRAEVDRLYREEHGRIVAPLIRLLGDFDRAEDIGGHFTLGLRLLPDGWRIVRDETTSD